ncbi:OmpA family protein [Alloacidobacterium dinghuense]|uniref:OmpA family protein n=1 Tax=Alloacidobacterium dinghuense TaxID=2763107 RepID=A0A7G8BPI8_9BACT|nr:flagellar motor protein MotB [Alloacidobacterium dinghuense]QNI34458.1 OmpA family protein [Alloacidobacterium dinghuense]
MRRRKDKHHANHERWLVSYADFITLLFAFFVVMYATSKADQRKQAEAAAAINSAFQSLGLFQSATPTKQLQGATDAGSAPAATQDETVTPMNVVMGDQMLASPQVQEDFERIKRHLEGLLSNQIARHVVALRIGREGLIISLREAGFFDSGSAVPHPSSLATLGQIAEALRTTPYDIRIEGHTDNVPIHTDLFDSNWELSTARATHLARIFIVGHQFAPARLSASGYAEYHPTASNETADGRAQNRRVDIIVLPRVTTPASPAVHVPAAKPAAIAAAIPAPTATAEATARPLP